MVFTTFSMKLLYLIGKIDFNLPIFVRRYKHFNTAFSKLTMGTTINTFVFMDCETTGLPFQENNCTKITELTLCVVDSLHLEMMSYPRVQNKLHLCFNPKKIINSKVSEITKLSNKLLEKQPSFSKTTANLIKEFLILYPKPICFVAHNGNKFDYPILRAELNNTGEEFLDDIYCVDSLDAVRYFHAEDTKPCKPLGTDVPLELEDGFDDIILSAVENIDQNNGTFISCPESPKFKDKMLKIQKINETTPKKPLRFRQNFKSNDGFKSRVSYKLGDVFERITGQPVEKAHSAEYDVDALIIIAVSYGNRFTNWANQVAKKFSEIQPMTPKPNRLRD